MYGLISLSCKVKKENEKKIPVQNTSFKLCSSFAIKICIITTNIVVYSFSGLQTFKRQLLVCISGL